MIGSSWTCRLLRPGGQVEISPPGGASTFRGRAVMARRTTPRRERWPTAKTKLAALIDEAIVDAYGESEQRTAFYTLLDQHWSPRRQEPVARPVCARLEISVYCTCGSSQW